MNDLETTVIKKIAHSRRYLVGTYDYFVWPYKGIDEIPPQELRYLISEMAKLVPKTTQTLLSFMTDGDILSVPLAQLIQLPIIICRDFHYNMGQHLRIKQKTLYHSRNLYIERPKSGRIICIVDAIISSGATIAATIRALKNANCEISGVVAAIAKKENAGVERINRELGIKASVLFEMHSNCHGEVSIGRVK